MTITKPIVKLLTIFVYPVIYLLVAFITTEVDFTSWSEGVRVAYIVTTVPLQLCTFVILNMYYEESKK